MASIVMSCCISSLLSVYWLEDVLHSQIRILEEKLRHKNRTREIRFYVCMKQMFKIFLLGSQMGLSYEPISTRICFFIV